MVIKKQIQLQPQTHRLHKLPIS